MPTQGNLIELLPFFVYAQYADVANVVMAAGVHAARNVEIYIAKIMHKVGISQLALNGFCNGYGLGVGQRAKSPPGQQMTSVIKPALRSPDPLPVPVAKGE